MKHNRHNRGSVILLVVGVLTALAMIGCVFIMITWTDRKDASAATEAAPMQPVAEGVLGMICGERTVKDLSLAASGAPGYGKQWPFSSGVGIAGGNALAATTYIDYASTDVDNVLASTEWEYGLVPTGNRISPQIKQWRHMTVLPGITYPQGANGLDPTKPNNVNISALAPLYPLYDTNHDGSVTSSDATSLVDTDGDNEVDAVLFPTGVFARRGNQIDGRSDQYYAAVRIVDLGAFLNANVMNASGGVTQNIMPSSVDLQKALSMSIAAPAPLVSAINISRCWSGNVGTLTAALIPATFNDYLATRLQHPGVPAGGGWTYRPFDIGDELALRSGRTGLSNMWNGRFFQLYSSLGANNLDDFQRSQSVLTTASTDRVLLRHPEYPGQSGTIGAPTRDPQVTVTVDPGTGAVTVQSPDSLVNPMTPDAFADSLKTYIEPLLPAGITDRNRMVAQFAANLLAYKLPYPPANDSSDPVVMINYTKPDNSTGQVFGVKPQIVISEAYAKAEKVDDGTGAGTFIIKKAFAIELYNPTQRPKDLTKYQVSSTAGATALSGVLQPGTFIVFYHWEGYGSAAEAGFPATAVDTPGVDLSFGNTVDLRRMEDPVGAPASFRVPVDQVASTDLVVGGFSTDPATMVVGAVKEADAARTTDPELCYVAVYKQTATGNTLNASNVGVTWNTLGLQFPVPIDEQPPVITNVGMLANLYLTGPHDTVPFTCAIRDEFKDGPCRGKPNLYPANLPPGDPQDIATVAVPSTLTASNLDAPWADLLLEVFSQLRGDPTTQMKREAYGRLNINTASRDTIYALLNGAGVGVSLGLADVDRRQMAEFIVAYRDQRGVQLAPGFTTQLATPVSFDTASGTTRAGRTGIAGLRTNDNSRSVGFLSPGEVAIPMIYYLTWKLNPTANPALAVGKAIYPQWNSTRALNELYGQISNLITVRSDAMCAYIQVQLGPDPSTMVKRNYVAIIDRSNCSLATDKPVVRAFAEMKQP